MKIHQIPVGHMENFCYYIEDGKESAIIDPAWEYQKIIEIIEESKAKLKYIILTHGHFDHIEQVANIKKKYDVPILMHPKEKSIIKATQYIEENEVIRVGNTQWEVLHLPGHSPGSIALLHKNHLIAGDTLFVHAFGRYDLPGGNKKQLFESIQKLKKLPVNTIVYPGHNYGPTPTSTIGEEKEKNPAMNTPYEYFE